MKSFIFGKQQDLEQKKKMFYKFVAELISQVISKFVCISYHLEITVLLKFVFTSKICNIFILELSFRLSSRCFFFIGSSKDLIHFIWYIKQSYKFINTYTARHKLRYTLTLWSGRVTNNNKYCKNHKPKIESVWLLLSCLFSQ